MSWRVLLVETGEYMYRYKYGMYLYTNYEVSLNQDRKMRDAFTIFKAKTKSQAIMYLNTALRESFIHLDADMAITCRHEYINIFNIFEIVKV